MRTYQRDHVPVCLGCPMSSDVIAWLQSSVTSDTPANDPNLYRNRARYRQWTDRGRILPLCDQVACLIPLAVSIFSSRVAGQEKEAICAKLLSTPRSVVPDQSSPVALDERTSLSGLVTDSQCPRG